MQISRRLEALLQYEEESLDVSNEGKLWTDEELRCILRMPVCQESYIMLAKALKRTPASIEAIFRWAADD